MFFTVVKINFYWYLLQNHRNYNLNILSGPRVTKNGGHCRQAVITSSLTLNAINFNWYVAGNHVKIMWKLFYMVMSTKAVEYQMTPSEQRNNFFFMLNFLISSIYFSHFSDNSSSVKAHLHIRFPYAFFTLHCCFL